jgi:hypothetical protein
MNDSELDDLLRSARGHVPLPDSFRQRVWHRIETSSVKCWHPFSRLEGIFGFLLRPAGAVLAVASMITFGLWLGAASIPNPAAPKITYVESISPFAGAHGK